MERMRELVQQSTSGSTELAASAEQMSKMSRELLDAMERVAGNTSEIERRVSKRDDRSPLGVRHAAAGAHS
jgi:methyl-accepting chemotaxis protein